MHQSRVGRVKFVLAAVIGVLTLQRSVDCSGSSPRRLDEKQPHIVIIVADDMGWNDVGFHGSIQIPTPNIDALAYSGVILNRHYVLPTCTPSRAALLTGKYPIFYGLQGNPLPACEPTGLSLNEKVLPQYLKDLGYSTHLVGKWHLGFYKRRFTPTQRGFDSHFGYWNGFISYRNSTLVSRKSMTGKDARRGFERAGNEMDERYATEVFTEEALKIIASHKHQETPMFLMVSHLAPHTGNPGPNLLEVSNKTYNDMKFSYIENENRRLYAGMVASLDESVGAIIESLYKNDMLQDSIILFMSDNGAPTEDQLWGYSNFGSNWPLRGEKGSLLDGGVRGLAAMWSPRLKDKHSTSENLFHITDWLPTLYTAAGGNIKDLGRIDGVDQWNSLTNTSKQTRSTVLINIDETVGEEALILNQWKVVKSNRTSDLSFALRYNGEPGDTGPDYNMSDVVESPAGSFLSKINCIVSEEDCMDTSTARDLFYNVRSKAKIDRKCADRISDPRPNENYECFDGHCLFDIQNDPCEYRNVRKENQEILDEMIDILERFKKNMTKQNRQDCDPDADPLRFDGYWDSWMEFNGSASSYASIYTTTTWLFFLSYLYVRF